MTENSNLDKVVERIQDFILEKESKIQSDVIGDHAYNPRNVGRIKDVEGFGIIAGYRGARCISISSSRNKEN